MPQSRIQRELSLGQIGSHSEVILKQIRGIDGRFRSMNQQAKLAHEQMAKEAAQTVQEVLRRRIAETGREQVLRPARDAEARLLDLIVADGNRYASQDGWVVGRSEFLDSTPVAPYWRNLEEGTSIFVGRQFRGYFITGGGDWIAPSGRRKDPRLVQLQSAGNVARGRDDMSGDYRQKPTRSYQLREPDGTNSYNVLPDGTRANRGGTVTVGGQYGARSGNRGTSANPISTRPQGIARFTQFDREQMARQSDLPSDNPRSRRGLRATTKGRAPLITIRNPIQPYRYFEVGGERFFNSGRITEIYRQHGLPVG